jgi:TRAP-type transport system periplasmic protein
VVIDINRRVNAELHDKLPKSCISIAEYCRKNGLEVIDLTPEEHRAFQKAVVPVWNNYRKKIGNEIFNFMLGKIKEHQQ